MAKGAKKNPAPCSICGTMKRPGLSGTSGWVFTIDWKYRFCCSITCREVLFSAKRLTRDSGFATIEDAILEVRKSDWPYMSIRKSGNEWVILSRHGKVLGKYKTKKTATENLRSMEADSE